MLRLSPKLLIVVATLLTLPTIGCKRSSKNSRTSSLLEGTADLISVNSTTADAAQDCRNAMINLWTNAVSDGLLANGAVSGLGTDYPTGKKLATDSAYFQLLRIYSVIDWELPGAIKKAQSEGCLPESVSVGIGTYTEGYAKTKSEVFAEEAKALRKIESLLPITVRIPTIIRTDDIEDPRAWPAPTTISESMRQAQLEGTQAKLRYAREIGAERSDVKEKLRAMLTTLTPVAYSASGSFPAKGDPAPKIYAEMYLPPFSEFKADQINEVASWQLKQGLGMTPLPKEVDVNVARITHIGYLDPKEPPREPLIKFQIFKDFKNPDEVLMRVVFGMLDPSGDDQGRLPLRISNYRSAFLVSFYPNLAMRSDDGAIHRFLKTQVNNVANQFRIDARIHQLTLSLKRDGGKDPIRDGIDSILLHPHFSLRDSDISFRLHQEADSKVEARNLTRVSFTCTPTGVQQKQTCYRDFGAYAELESFLLEGPTRFSTRIGRRIMKTLNQLVAYNSKFLINLNMDAIEAAIDLQFATIVTDFMAEQEKHRSEIRKRLEEALFSTETAEGGGQ